MKNKSSKILIAYSFIIFFFFHINIVLAETGCCLSRPEGIFTYWDGCYNSNTGDCSTISADRKKIQTNYTANAECQQYNDNSMLNGTYYCKKIEVPQETNSENSANTNNLPQIKMPDLKIKIPYVNFTEVNCQPGQTCAIPWIGEYIVGVYKYIVYIMGIAAVIVLMIGGVRWLTAGGSSSAVEDAKSWITASLSGLLITLLSFLILQQINPKLTQFDPITINMVEKINIELLINGSESEMEVNSMSSPTATGNYTTINCGGGIKCSKNSMMLREETNNALNIAAQLAEKEGIKLTITSAYRTLEEQQALWNEAVKKHGSEASKYVARPSVNSPHVTGTAVDICIDGYCNKMNSGNANLSNEKIQKLQNIMKQAGFIRYCGEWWHFEYGSGRKNGC